ncbi:disease resistance protein At4g27190-like [Punica granatum]|uniref:Disease resistance protein At4g27190-like n=1 Tax=Punica granatum TaxID=22663 RepID=A0A6P8ECI1_PUNGR|nr:disease resistance protein At4g27190-like [Punica granatum]XP_031404249.1 disease resistance protein At4g27190-like [Punica granatum]XP_031404250.1 disease resistance protein At4g27190-like [Punica granatum]XP_031404251.1 disease resistance protein At4g27190-like [Punica granatum]XP_031404252.1 disease resistance protein At4g27190-like [Punica granatum]
MGKPRDPIWNYVKVILDEGKACRWQCRCCDEIFSGGASRIKAHLGNVEGQGIKVCEKADEATKKIANTKRRRLETGTSSAQVNTQPQLPDLRNPSPFFDQSNHNAPPPRSPDAPADPREISICLRSLGEFCGETEVEGPSNAPGHIYNRSIMPCSAFHLPEEGNQDPCNEVDGLMRGSHNAVGLPWQFAPGDPGDISICPRSFGEFTINLLQEACGETEVEGPSNAPGHINNRGIMPRSGFHTSEGDPLRNPPDAIPLGTATLSESHVSSVIRGLHVETDRPENSRMSLPAVPSFHLPEEGNQDPCNEVDGPSATPIGQPSTGPAGGARDAVGGTFIVRELVGRQSRRIVDEIWVCLTNNISRIGVYGMAGVGKTTVLKHLHNKTRAAFRGVFWVTVSKDCTIHELQNKIAKGTEAQDLFRDKDEAKRSSLLFEHLRKKKNTLIILDDVWQHFELHEVGIPEDCIRVVLTTRDRAVCQKMLCQKEIKVEPLPYNDAWTMFVDTLGSKPSPRQKRFARCIVKECKGLPLAIVVMAGSMRGVQSDYGWADTLEKLRQPQALQQDMQTGVFPILQHSYSCLDPKKQQCLLRCALYPEDEKIGREELIEFCIDEGVIHGDNRRKMRNEGHRLLDELEKACLLELCNTGDFRQSGGWGVRMHDVIRDMAISIMRTYCRVKSGLHLDDVPDDEDEWFPDLQKVSLMENDIKVIPSSISPNCHQLSTLLLSRCTRLREISGCFFDRIGGLKVINLSFTHIRRVPESITNLEKLKALILNGCSNLSLLPSLEKLTSLRKLDLQGCTKIKEVPDGLRMLVNVTYLDLSRTGIERIPYGVISKLQKLQHLIADNIEVKGEEVGKLKKLELIQCCFQNVKELNKYTQAHNKTMRNSRSYSIFIGGPARCLNYWGDRFVNLRDRCRDGENIRSYHLPRDVKELSIEFNSWMWNNILASLTRLEELERLRIEGGQPELIEGQPPLKHLLGVSHIMRVRFLEVCSCDGGESIIGAEAAAGESPHAFSQLESIEISDCGKAKNVVGHQLLPRLQNLRCIRIGWVANMEEIIVMPSPQPFPAATSALLLPSLTEIRVYGCHKMKRALTLELFMLLPNLSCISVHDCDQMEEIIAMPAQLPATCTLQFHLLTYINVDRCHKMKRVLTFELFTLLPNLNYISVDDCEQMKEVIGHGLEHGGGAMVGYSTTSSLLLSPYAPSADQSRARQLTLILRDLGELESICSGTGLRDLIHVIDICKCPKLKRIEMLDGIFASPPHSLKEIILSGDGIGEWWESLEWNYPEAKTALRRYVFIKSNAGFHKTPIQEWRRSRQF